ncbi:hypothetical protein Sjap_005638 [Stephania japonica]|uniref:Uncharacterized protein n=1 Tax=Stephania japonica TaxID=461633 RepID=A0AAP0PLC2_9MAGN
MPCSHVFPDVPEDYHHIVPPLPVLSYRTCAITDVGEKGMMVRFVEMLPENITTFDNVSPVTCSSFPLDPSKSKL